LRKRDGKKEISSNRGNGREENSKRKEKGGNCGVDYNIVSFITLKGKAIKREEESRKKKTNEKNRETAKRQRSWPDW